MVINMPPNQNFVGKSKDVLNIHLNVLHLHLIHLLLLLWGVTIHKFLPLQVESHILPVLMGGGWQCAVRDLGVVALIGEVTESLLLKPAGSVLSTTESTAQMNNEAEVEKVQFSFTQAQGGLLPTVADVFLFLPFTTVHADLNV